MDEQLVARCPTRPPKVQIKRDTSSLDLVNGHRDQPNEVIPEFLFLGSQKAALNATEMEHLGITRYLCCALEAPLPNHIPAAKLESGEVLLCHIPMRDGVKTQLQEHFNDAFTFLRAAKRDKQRVLVYCREGKSRSASIVIAYLIRYLLMSYEEALAVVRSRRSVVDPNFAFCHQLHSYGEDVLEKRATCADLPSSPHIVIEVPTQGASPPTGISAQQSPGRACLLDPAALAESSPGAANRTLSSRYMMSTSSQDLRNRLLNEVAQLDRSLESSSDIALDSTSENPSFALSSSNPRVLHWPTSPTTALSEDLDHEHEEVEDTDDSFFQLDPQIEHFLRNVKGAEEESDGDS